MVISEKENHGATIYVYSEGTYSSGQTQVDSSRQLDSKYWNTTRRKKDKGISRWNKRKT
jgi:hypothetical protein